jgi:hypothetical protein
MKSFNKQIKENAKVYSNLNLSEPIVTEYISYTPRVKKVIQKVEELAHDHGAERTKQLLLQEITPLIDLLEYLQENAELSIIITTDEFGTEETEDLNERITEALNKWKRFTNTGIIKPFIKRKPK